MKITLTAPARSRQAQQSGSQQGEGSGFGNGSGDEALAAAAGIADDMDADAEVREQVAEVSAGQAQQEFTRLGRDIVLGMTPDAVAGGRVVGSDVERLVKTDVGAARKVSASLSGQISIDRLNCS